MQFIRAGFIVRVEAAFWKVRTPAVVVRNEQMSGVVEDFSRDRGPGRGIQFAAIKRIREFT